MGTSSNKQQSEDQDDNNDVSKWRDAVISILHGVSDERQSHVKAVRKLVLLSLQLDDVDDKSAKKQFKRVVKGLEESGTISINEEGKMTLIKKSKKRSRKEDKESKKEKKKQKEPTESPSREDDGDHNMHQETIELKVADANHAEDDSGNHSLANQSPAKLASNICKGNPQGVTRLFVGNLPFAVDETSLGSFLLHHVTHIKWITDKETGKFYGSAFVEMDSIQSAADAVLLTGSHLMGRPIKVNFALSRPGEKWPPENKVVTGGGTGNNNTKNNSNNNVTTGGQAGGTGIKALSAKPENCVKLFIGNLSYDIDDDGIIKFFASVDAEVKAVRWLFHQDSGDFKGCGFVEFWNTEACEKGAVLNGKNLLGRPIRIDWSD